MREATGTCSTRCAPTAVRRSGGDARQRVQPGATRRPARPERRPHRPVADLKDGRRRSSRIACQGRSAPSARRRRRRRRATRKRKANQRSARGEEGRAHRGARSQSGARRRRSACGRGIRSCRPPASSPTKRPSPPTSGRSPSATTSPPTSATSTDADKLAMVHEDCRRQRPRGEVGRAPGALQPLRQRAARARRRARRPRRDAAAADARDRRGVLRHLQVRARSCSRCRCSTATTASSTASRDSQAKVLVTNAANKDRVDPSLVEHVLILDDDLLAERRRRVRRRRHRGRRPGAALLLLRHDRAGQGHPPRAPLPARARGVRLLPRRAGRRALPRHGRVGVGGRHRAAARAVALRRGPVRATSARAASTRTSSSTFLSRHEVTNVFTTPTAMRSMMAHRGRGRALPAEVPHRLLGRRAAEPRGDPLVPRAVRRHGARLLRAHGVLSAVRQLPVHGGARGLDGQADAGLGRADPRRGREAAAAGRARRDLPARALEPALSARLLEQRRRTPRRRSAATGSTPRTPPRSTRTATSGTRAAPTT